MNALVFRNAKPSDLQQIMEIYNSTISSGMVTADTQPVSTESRQQWFEDHYPDERPLWVVESNAKEIVGWVSFQSFYGRPAYAATAEISIYIAESQRGKGIGKQVLQYCLDKAPDLGIKTLLGFIFAHNGPSLKLFRHFGFEDWATLPDIALIEGQERSLKILGKRIVP